MTMEYKGYIAGPIDIDPDAGTLSGTITGLDRTIQRQRSALAKVRRTGRVAHHHHPQPVPTIAILAPGMVGTDDPSLVRAWSSL